MESFNACTDAACSPRTHPINPSCLYSDLPSCALYVSPFSSIAVVYATHELLATLAPFQWSYSGIASHSQFLASNITGVCTLLVLARYLYLKGIFINV